MLLFALPFIPGRCLLGHLPSLTLPFAPGRYHNLSCAPVVGRGSSFLFGAERQESNGCARFFAAAGEKRTVVCRLLVWGTKTRVSEQLKFLAGSELPPTLSTFLGAGYEDCKDLDMECDGGVK